MRIKNGILKELSKKSGLNIRYLSDLAATTKRPGRQRALELERAAAEIGLCVSASLWMFGTSEQIKAALMDNKKPNIPSFSGEPDELMPNSYLDTEGTPASWK